MSVINEAEEVIRELANDIKCCNSVDYGGYVWWPKSTDQDEYVRLMDIAERLKAYSPHKG